MYIQIVRMASLYIILHYTWSIFVSLNYIKIDELALVNLQRVREAAEVFDLSSKEQVTKLGEGQEDDDKHHEEASQIFGAATQGRGQLGHRLVETDVLEDLQAESMINIHEIR